MDRTHVEASATELRPGDLVTETGTPAGPWYVVLAVEPAAGLLVVDGGDGLRVEIPLPAAGAVVLRRASYRAARSA